MDLCSWNRNRNRNRNRSCTSFDDLPDGLVVDILSRLPVKTIVQSTCINKLWYSLIKHPSFISTHLSRSISDPSNSCILIITNSFPDSSLASFSVFSDNNHVITRHPNFNIPFQTRSGSYKMIGACNGLVCLTDGLTFLECCHDFYLFNPFIQKYRKIGVESSCYPDLIDQIDGFSGQIWASFWYCEIEKDYKIFRMILRYDDAKAKMTIVFRGFEIYSLYSGKWKVMEGMEALHDYVLNDYVNGGRAIVNGCLYWLNLSSTSLQCYDLKEKKLYNISLPTTIQPFGPFHLWSVFLAKDGSVVIRCTKDEFSNDNTSWTSRIYLSFLEKDIGGQLRWKELFYYESCDTQIYEHYMGFSANGRLMFVEFNGKTMDLVALDIDKLSAIEKHVLVADDDADHLTTGAFNVFESFVLFSG